MLKINFFSFQPKSATFLGYKAIFDNLPNISYNSKDFINFNINIFTGFEKEVKYLEKNWLKISSKSKIGIVDPKNIKLVSRLPNLDFIIVDSIEMELQFSGFMKPIYRLSEFPKVTLQKQNKVLNEKNKITIGYHGNRQHIISMFPNITSALNELGKKYNVELRLIYNFHLLSKVPNLFPDNISVKHIQWRPNIYSELYDCDIGLVPNLMPIKKKSHQKISVSRFFLEKDDDYIMRFKMLSNPGRLLLFWSIGIPVVADITPSHIEIIRHGENSYLAYDKKSYLRAFFELSNKQQNIKCRQNLERDYMKFDHKMQAERFLKDLRKKNFYEPLLKNNELNYTLTQLLQFKFIYPIDIIKKLYKKVRKTL